MSKYLSREFILAFSLMIVATAAMFTGKASFVEWTAACGAFIGVYTGGKTVQKIKGK